MRSFYQFLAALVLAGVFQVAAADTPAWQGRKLSEYLDLLNAQGLKIIYSSDLVTDEMRLESEPDPDDVENSLRQVLRPLGLGVSAGPANSLLIVRTDADRGKQDAQTEAPPVELSIPEIVVTSSLHRLDYSYPESHTYLDRELVTRIPTAADEAVRLTDRLPGTASGGVSTRNHIRGGEANEVLFLFDGLRLYEPYHLKDFQAIATIVNSNAIGGMDFYTGAYPARYGDRMSGVLSVDLRQPGKPIETELALSFFNASVLSIGTFGSEQQGEWLVTARRGNLDLVVDVIDPDIGDPVYQDYLGHIAWEFGPRLALSANFLVSDDKLTLVDKDQGERATASYSNQVFWLKWRAAWTDALSSDSIIAISDITDRRAGDLNLPGIVSGTLSDVGEFSAVEFRQDWSWIVSPKWMLRFGVNLKDLDADYRFSSQKTVAQPFDSILDNQPSTSLDFNLAPAGAQYAAYTELRWRPADRWTIDLGLRWDQQNYTTAEDDKQYSPRASILYQPGERTDIRFGWGQYHQAQEINELQISDGIDSFFAAQRAEHFVLNLQHAFERGFDLNLSVYRKSFRTVRPRFENSFNLLTLLPELQFDRVRVDATGAEALGAELTLSRGSSNEDMLWWLAYAWSEVEDETQTGDVRRSWDQTHTVKAGLSWQWGSWAFSAAGEVHTGWPQTLLTGEAVPQGDGSTSLVLEVTDRNSLRYPVFHSLDARVSRRFDLARGDLTAFLEVSNLYNRANPCCTEYALQPDGSLTSRKTHWLPLVPSLGVVWRF